MMCRIIREPIVSSRIGGFEFAVKRRSGVLLTTEIESEPISLPEQNMSYRVPAMDRPEVQRLDNSVNFYYEVKIRATGKNSEYPEQEQPWIHKYTTLLRGDSTYGSEGRGISSIPGDRRFKRFELVEEFDDGKWKSGTTGRFFERPPHHKVVLYAYFNAKAGRSRPLTNDLMIRKSDQETQAWKDYLKRPPSRVRYI